MTTELSDLLPGRAGHFRLESGHHGELWLELDLLFLRPARLAPLAAALAARLAPHGADAVCGPLVGGGLLAQAVAGALGTDLAWAERLAAGDAEVSYRIPPALHAALRGRRVAVVDDAINAGSAVRATLAALRAAGARPVALGALLALGEAPARVAAGAGLPLEALSALPARLWLPAECPLCAAGVPLETPLEAGPSA